jgi:OOP family OmpA-OmpF porin
MSKAIILNSLILISLLNTTTLLLRAADVPVTVELTAPLSTASSHKGDPVTARVVDPPALAGDSLEGHVTEVRQGNKLHGEAVLNFRFETLKHQQQSIAVEGSITSISNSKGQVDVDEEGRVLRHTNNLGKLAAGTGAGALIGGLTHGWKGAAIGSVAGAAASVVLIEVAAQGPGVELAAGSRIGLSLKSRNGPDLASLAAQSTAASAPASSPRSEVLATPTNAESAAPISPSTAPVSAPPQPDLKASKMEFLPGEKTVFFDDFSDMAEDEPPPHWKLRDGAVELRTGGSIRQLTAVCPAKPSLSSTSFTFPKNFTVEIEAVFGSDGPSMTFLAWPKDVDCCQSPLWKIEITPTEVSFFGPKEDKIGTMTLRPALVNQPIKIGLWVQEGRARGYVNGERVGDVNQMFIPAGSQPADHWTIRERCDYASEQWIGLRRIRVAEAAPDFSAALSSNGRYVTHGILFDTDSDRLKPDSAPVIKAIARGLEKNPALKLEIDGYTDSTGNAEHNLDLSKRRAEAVKSVLISQFGIDPTRLAATGKGDASPIASNDTTEGRAENRRVEFLKK